MRYTVAEKIDRLKNPKHKEKIKKAAYYENELRLYTEAQNADELSNDTAFKDLLGLIQLRLPNKAYKRVLDFIEYPLESVDLTNSLLVKLYKVFQAKNTFFSHEIDSEQKNKQLTGIIKDLDVHQYIIENGKDVLKNKPNTIVVVDKDKDGKPYLVTVDTERLIDADPKHDGTMDYIAFIHSVDEQTKKVKIAFYDTETYAVFIFDKQTGSYTLDGEEIEHKIGYCPARYFIKTPLNSKNHFKRETPIGTSIGSLRKWQLFHFYKYYVKHYAPFPVVEKMKNKCGNEDCVNGWVPSPSPLWTENGERRELPRIRCTQCASNDVGVGMVINIIPKRKDEGEDASNKFRFIAPEITGLEFLNKDLADLEIEIEFKTVGQNNEVLTEAVNETQVKGSFQSRESVLVDLKELFEEIYIWICETAARAYFLGDVNVIVYANLGTEFYLISEDELQKRFEKAKSIGLPDSEVDAIYKQLITTKYKDNPDSILRMDLLKLIDPAPYANFEEVDKMKASGVITEQEYIIKRRFLNFINRLEFENTNLITFGKKLPLPERIKKINLILNNYANEYIEQNGNTEQSKPGAGSPEEN